MCSPRNAPRSCTAKSAGVAKRPREVLSHPKALTSRVGTFRAAVTTARGDCRRSRHASDAAHRQQHAAAGQQRSTRRPGAHRQRGDSSGSADGRDARGHGCRVGHQVEGLGLAQGRGSGRGRREHSERVGEGARRGGHERREGGERELGQASHERAQQPQQAQARRVRNRPAKAWVRLRPVDAERRKHYTANRVELPCGM
jgi:hypothetical protein